MTAFEDARDDHIAVYGPDNHLRLTGKHETQSIDQFSYGVADRGASIRVPHSFVNNGYKGYLEDRRPNSQGDPYQIASQILKTIASVPTDEGQRRGLRRGTYLPSLLPARSGEKGSHFRTYLWRDKGLTGSICRPPTIRRCPAARIGGARGKELRSPKSSRRAGRGRVGRAPSLVAAG